MTIDKFREEIGIPDNIIKDSYIQNMICDVDYMVDQHVEAIKDYVILYEACRKIGDLNTMKYYKNKLLGKLGMVI